MYVQVPRYAHIVLCTGLKQEVPIHILLNSESFTHYLQSGEKVLSYYSHSMHEIGLFVCLLTTGHDAVCCRVLRVCGVP